MSPGRRPRRAGDWRRQLERGKKAAGTVDRSEA